MQFTTFLSLAIAAVVPALAADNAAQENIELEGTMILRLNRAPSTPSSSSTAPLPSTTVMPLASLRELPPQPPYTPNQYLMSIYSVTGEIHSVRQAHGITCHIYFDHNCGGDSIPVTVDIPDVIHDHHKPALSARCYR
ncbi:hypothetical protein ASPNIDRAFT_53548 [Aspergillus niger ATCC 1015]|uniref:Uncharacterized protein n=1 Tax=Aspergillus niger (strain ATCC 1015 / CBS 113.46 / FGSC A1144 / LSHB Ac4 / NCTC 3858a / NRRL 328 / USDA 3528.7) TaxID=380704 RepID=G3Y6G2_ASPNA|nr:hypothetical protein ASPNIDRAFT_53548 [Aspergillus niger ATCC 1015]